MLHTNIIAIKNVIILEKARKKEGQLIERNGIKQAEVVKMSSSIDLDSKYIWTRSNTDIDAIRDLGITGIKKY